MAHKTKAQKLQEAYMFYDAEKQGKRPKCQAADGSIPTHPVIQVPPLPESEVLAQCLKWLKTRRVVCWRHDCAKGDLGHGYAQYGIKGAGDIIGLIKTGRYFEIETKAGKGGRLSIAQQKHKNEVESSNGIYLIIHGVFELELRMRGLI